MLVCEITLTVSVASEAVCIAASRFCRSPAISIPTDPALEAVFPLGFLPLSALAFHPCSRS